MGISWGCLKDPIQQYSFVGYGYFSAEKFLVLAPSRSQVPTKEYCCMGSHLGCWWDVFCRCPTTATTGVGHLQKLEVGHIQDVGQLPAGRCTTSLKYDVCLL